MILKQTYSNDEIHNQWISVYRSDSAQEAFNEQLLARILSTVNPPQNALVLDAGCGIGTHSIRMVEKGYRCVGVDISENVLDKARERARRAQLDSNLGFLCQSLENLDFEDEKFDIVHCRGVLTHIPEWEKALLQLCRVLKASGWLVLIEANCSSVEMAMVRFVRSLMTREAKMVESDSGVEFWAEVCGSPFVYRYTNMEYLIGQLKLAHVEVRKKMCAEFWDLNRFPGGLIRQGAIRFNRIALQLGLPASLSSTCAILGEKVSSLLN